MSSSISQSTFTSNFLPHRARHLLVVAGASVAVIAIVVKMARSRDGLTMSESESESGNGNDNENGKVIKSPRMRVLNESTEEERDALPYPLDVFPGGRDVESAYGSMRVYEWGPEDGRKVLLIHGITTPCIALGSVANALVDKRCRVLLFDLFGRGYSDSPDLPHDVRLYTTQILLALTSSSLSWTSASEGFSLIGYSLGGGIAAEFAVHFSAMIKELVLLAPSGLIRSRHFGWASSAVYSPLVPDSLVHWIVGRRLRGASNQKSQSEEKDVDEKSETDKVVNAEIKGNRDPQFESAVLSVSRPGVTVACAVQWQVENHPGFVRSFVSSIRYAPIENQMETWRKLGEGKGRVVVIAGTTDAVILCDELKEDVMALTGPERVIWREIEGGHEFPITKGHEVVDVISQIWSV